MKDRATDTVLWNRCTGGTENGFLGAEKSRARPHYQYCTAFPVGTVMAQTWNRDLMQRFGEAVALEMEAFLMSIVAGTGLNIHRNSFVDEI